jgi:hypothetical protein
MGDEKPTPEQRVRELYEDQESRTAAAFERLVKRDSFGEILAMATENLVAVMKLGNDAADLVLRNLRLASRRDLTQLGRQLARTEDKVELLLQEIEALRDEGDTPSRNGRSGSRGRARSSSAEQ